MSKTLAWLEDGRIVIDLRAAIEALGQTPPAAAEWYDCYSYPFGKRVFRRHISAGMPAVRAGKAYRVRIDDAEMFWATLKRKPKLVAPTSTPKGIDAASQLAKAGIRLLSPPKPKDRASPASRTA